MKFFTLPQAIVLSVAGAQAERYLQVRLTNDIKLLTPQRALYAAALTPQGRCEALFTVLSNTQRSFTLIADGGEPLSVLEALKRFIVTERIEFKDVSQEFLVLHLLPAREKEDMGAFLPPVAGHDAEFSRVSTAAIEFISRRRSTDWGWDVVIPKAQSAAFIDRLREKKAVELPADQQLLLRLRAGVPLFPSEINAEHIFSESGLNTAISYTKGCYTGQEVIAKIDALGKPPRMLFRLSLAGSYSISSGATVTAPTESRAVGEVLSSALDAETGVTWAFASLRSSLDFEKTKLFIADHEATIAACATAPTRRE